MLSLPLQEKSAIISPISAQWERNSTKKALSQFRLYLIIGGMPAAIMEYKKKRSSCWYLTPSKSSLHLYPVDTGLCSCILKIPAFQLLSGEETTAGTACIETFLAQHFIRNGYASPTGPAATRRKFPFLLSKNSHFYCHRLPHRTTSEVQEPYAAE